jgi:NAD-dependent SIR2 family protein deacetylase
MSTCQNCGSFVTDAYARVFSPTEDDRVRTCPRCEDMVRKGNGQVRPARNVKS